MLSINPVITTNAPGSFDISSTGYIQGQALDSPNARYNLAGGVLAQTETKPMFGGVAISELIPGGTAGSGRSSTLGTTIIRATTVPIAQTTATKPAGMITGFSVFDQAHHMISSAQSPVPQASNGMGVHYYRMGSGARIAVACDPALVALDGTIVTANVSWDFTNSVLQPYLASGGTEAVTSMTWANTNGGQMAIVAAAATLVGAVGDIVTISGATNTGTGGAAVVNGSFVVNTFTDSQHFTVLNRQAAGVVATIAGTILLNYGVGLLPVTVLDIEVGNSMTVVYDPVTGFATWNRQGTTAVILI